MLQRVETENGERWAIVFNECFALEDLVSMQNGILCVLKASTHSDILGSIGDGLYNMFELLSELTPTHDQASDYEKYLKLVRKMAN